MKILGIIAGVMAVGALWVAYDTFRVMNIEFGEAPEKKEKKDNNSLSYPPNPALKAHHKAWGEQMDEYLNHRFL